MRAGWAGSSLGERVLWAARLRGITTIELGRRAGIDALVMARLARQTARLASSPEVLAPLAEVAAVRLQWLALADGEPLERYPHRLEAARIARDGGLDEAAIRSVLEERFDLEADPSVLWWVRRIRDRAQIPERSLTPASSSGVRRRSTHPDREK